MKRFLLLLIFICALASSGRAQINNPGGSGSGLPAGGLVGQTVVNTGAGTGSWQSSSLPLGNSGAPILSTPYTIQCDNGTTVLDRSKLLVLGIGASLVHVPAASTSGCGTGFVFEVSVDGAGTATIDNNSSSDSFNVSTGGNNADGMLFFQVSNGQHLVISNTGVSNGGGGTIWYVQGVGTALPVGIVVPAVTRDGIIRFDGAMVAVPSTSGNSTTASTPTYTTQFANDDVLAVFMNSTADFSVDPATGTNLIDITWLSGQYGAFVNHQLVASAGSVAAVTGTYSATSRWSTATIPLVPVSGQTIAYRTPSTTQQATGATLTLNRPTGTTNGDFIVVCVSWFGTGNTLTAPAALLGGDRLLRVTDGGGNVLYCYSKFASSEPSTYVFTQSVTTNGMTGWVLAATNVLAVDDILTSASASFTSADLNKDVCVAAVSGQQTCGSVVQVVSGTTLLCNTCWNNSGSNTTNQEYRYGTDNTTVLQNSLNLLGTDGGTLWLPKGIILFNGQLTLPTTASVVIRGVASAAANWGFATGGTTVKNTNLGTQLVSASATLPTAAIILNPGTNGVVTNVYQDTLEDFALWGGAGTNKDGGGGFGLQLVAVDRFTMRNTIIGNFLGDTLNVSAVTAAGYTDGVELDNNWFLLSGGCGANFFGGNTSTFLMEDIILLRNQFDNNGSGGLCLANSIYNINIVGNEFQRNGASSQILLNANTIFNGCTFGSNYFETDSGGATAINVVAGLNGCTWSQQARVGTVSAPQLALVATGVSTNTDTAGTLTTSTSTVTYTFINTALTIHPICTANDETTVTTAVKVTYTAATSVTFTTPGASDVIDYICVPRN